MILFLKKSILNKFLKNNYDVSTYHGTLNSFEKQEFILNNLLNH